MTRMERRRAVRAKTSLLTAYRCLENGAVTRTGFGRTLNLSHIGALLEAPDVLAVGQVVELEFLLDENRLITVTGSVTRVKNVKAFCQAAVEFNQVNAKTRRLIDLQVGVRPQKKSSPRGKTAGKTKAKPKPKTKSSARTPTTRQTHVKSFTRTR